MTRKVLFIEDRPNRQIQFLPNGEDDLNNIKAIEGVDLRKEEDCKKVFESLNEGYIEEIEGYDLFLFHRSALKEKGLLSLKDHCSKTKTPLILFSGGVSQYTFQSENFPLLILNSKDFYSNRLIDFLKNFIEDKVESILEVLGANWELSFLMKYRNMLFITENAEELDQNTEEAFDELKEMFGDKSLSEINTEIKEQTLKL
jgi:hypothetical protein